MNPQLILGILALVEQAAQDEPKIAAALKNIFSKPEPTPADWQAERASIAALSYQTLVPNSDLPPAPAAG